MSRVNEPEAWWVETKPGELVGWRAQAQSSRGRSYGITVAFVGANVSTWRPTEKWARRRVERGLRRWLRREERLERRWQSGGSVYPVEL